MTKELIIDAATENDVADIISVLGANRGTPSLLQRSEGEVKQYLKDFFVVRDGQEHILGCVALHVYSCNSAEIFSLAVLPEAQGRGIGRYLMKECIRWANTEDIERLWLATQKLDYFAQFGFIPISLKQLPISVLLAKLNQVFRRPPNCWLLVLLRRQTIMQLELK